MREEENETDKLLGRLSAQDALQRELWSMFLKLTENSVEMAEVLRENMIIAIERESIFSNEVSAHRKYATTQTTIAHLEKFWDSVIERLKKS